MVVERKFPMNPWDYNVKHRNLFKVQERYVQEYIQSTREVKLSLSLCKNEGKLLRTDDIFRDSSHCLPVFVTVSVTAVSRNAYIIDFTYSSNIY